MENMINHTIAKNTDQLAAEINYIRTQTARQVIAASIEIGERLCAAKELVPFGEWESWLQDNVNYSQSTAQNLMRIYREYGDRQTALFSQGQDLSEIFGEITYSQAIALFALPMDERVEFTQTHDMENISTRELKAEIERYKAEKAVADETIAELQQRTEEQEAAITAANEAATCSQRQSDKHSIEAKTEQEKRRQVEAQRDALKQELAELANRPPEITPEQREEIERQIEAKYSNQIAQLSLDAETAQQNLQAAENERSALERKLQNESNVELQKFQTLFERLQHDISALIDLTETIGGERGDKLRDIMWSTLMGMADSSNN